MFLLLSTTAASYDESNLMSVLNDILRDDGMLDSRANPGIVPKFYTGVCCANFLF